MGGQRLAVHVADDRLLHHRRHAVQRLDGPDGAVFIILHVVQAGDITAGNIGHRPQQTLFPPFFRFGFADQLADGGQLFLALAQHHHVDEVGQRLGVAHAGPARHHQRPFLAAVGRAQRDARHVQHGQDVGVGKLVLQCEAHHVKGGERVFALQAVQRDGALFHLGLHVHPRHEGALAPPAGILVQQLVQNLHAQEGHAHLVGIGEAEGKAQVQLGLVLIHTARFAAGVAARFLHGGQRRLQFFVKHQFLPTGQKSGAFRAEMPPAYRI